MTENIYQASDSLNAQATAGFDNNSGQGAFYALPDGIKGWSWGAFTFNWIWALFNRTWFGLWAAAPLALLLALMFGLGGVIQRLFLAVFGIPLIGLFAALALGMLPLISFFVAIMLGVRGREVAWQSLHWDSVEHFQRVQRRWSICAVVLLVTFFGGTALLAGLGKYSNMSTGSNAAAALEYSTRAADAVASYEYANHRLPKSIAETGFTEAPPSQLKSLAIDQENGRLVIVTTIELLHEEPFYLAPVLRSGKLSWRCLHGNINADYLPAQCKFDTADSLHIP